MLIQWTCFLSRQTKFFFFIWERMREHQSSSALPNVASVQSCHCLPLRQLQYKRAEETTEGIKELPPHLSYHATLEQKHHTSAFLLLTRRRWSGSRCKTNGSSVEIREVGPQGFSGGASTNWMWSWNCWWFGCLKRRHVYWAIFLVGKKKCYSDFTKYVISSNQRRYHMYNKLPGVSLFCFIKHLCNLIA